MTELLRNLPPGAVVLDLGCAAGSFPAAGSAYLVVPIDLERTVPAARNFVQADAAMLPFPQACFDVVISNHSLEHFENLAGALSEVRRVVKPGGALYVAVPDASTISDRLYRWLARGGGHVNAFTSAPQLARDIERATGLKHAATRTLCTSLSCLHRANRRAPAPRRLWLLGGGTGLSLLLLTYAFRLCDRAFGTRASIYGWALYFGAIHAEIDRHTWTNVCVRCGAGHPSEWLRQECRAVRRMWPVTVYRCPGCGTLNLFTDDDRERTAGGGCGSPPAH